jgi:hypothetical protein
MNDDIDDELVIDDRAGTSLHVTLAEGVDDLGIVISIDEGYRGDRGVTCTILLTPNQERDLWRYLDRRQS